MRTGPMSELAGDLSDSEPAKRKCGKCGGAMRYQTWESSCFGYEEYKYTCTACGHVVWVDGIDS